MEREHLDMMMVFSRDYRTFAEIYGTISVKFARAESLGKGRNMIMSKDEYLITDEPP